MSENLFKIFDAGPEQFDRVKRLFTCTACGCDVMRGGKFFPSESDFIIFCGCECLTISFWELETAHPGPVAWCELLKLAKKRNVEFIVFGPNTKGSRYGNN